MRFLILGSGPAGYAAASTAAALGAEVTIVDRMALGGNWTMTDGIPSKTLLQVASSMAEIERAESRGVVFEHGRPRVDLLRAEAHARFIGQHQSRGVRERLDLTEATIVYGQGAVERDGALIVTTERGPRTLEYDHLLVCTGAAPWEPPFAQVDHQRVLNTRDVLGLHALPEQLLVVGAGATGCEFAEFFQSCGTRVTLLSSRPQILPSEDRDVADVVHEAFLERGMAIELEARASNVERDGDCVRVTAEDARAFTGTHAIICMGMRAHTEELGLESVGVQVGERGEIVIDGNCRTSNENISAAGDVTGGWMLASTAAMQGRIAALSALGRAVDPMSLDAIAGTVFTRPEVAGVGLTESKAEEKGVHVAVTRQPLRANPRGLIAGQSDGMIKLVWDPESGRLLGGSIVGYRASEVIMTVALAVKAQLTVDTLAETGAVNPSVSESLQRCAERAANARMARAGTVSHVA
jgi:pyruvate/2-oxoglutarate dehydrogenase complex dihydrolipoamide dehydrogenase (E3) component